MNTNPGVSADETDQVVPERHAVRLRMKPSVALRGFVDGAWWPRSRDPRAEFPGLALAMSSWVGTVGRVAYNPGNWERVGRDLTVADCTVRLVGYPSVDVNTVVVTGPNQRRVILLVVPPDIPGGVARAVLRSAAGADTVGSVEEILTSNGVRIGEHAAVQAPISGVG